MENLHKLTNTIKSQSAIRVRAFGGLNTGWFYSITDSNKRVLAADFGELPKGYTFNADSAILYSLAQASRRVSRDFPRSRVVMVNAAQPGHRVERKRAA
jgi:hypothetical protein